MERASSIGFPHTIRQAVQERRVCEFDMPVIEGRHIEIEIAQLSQRIVWGEAGQRDHRRAALVRHGHGVQHVRRRPWPY